LVPVCLSASHIAYGSIRMEPVFMILGQTAANAAALALDGNSAVQDISYPALKAQLQQEGQVLSWQATADTSDASQFPVARFTGPASNLSEFFNRLKAGDKQTVIVYGTSLTAGGAWTGSLKNWFEQQFPGQVNFINSGLSGKTSQEGVDQLQAKVLDLKPDLVFIEFSINDAHVRFNMPVEQSKANLDKIVSGIQAQNPKAAIVLQIMNQPWDAPNGNRSYSDRPQLAAFTENYRTYAREHNLLLIDHAPAWQKLQDTRPELYRTYLPDGLHPNGEGSNAITWPAIRQMLEVARDAK
jgi:lysophospholipase L1-like esterase